MFRFRSLAVSLAVILILTGCASSRSANVYPRSQTRTEMIVRPGVIESVREVTLEGTKSGVGSASGVIIGGVAGSTIGGGRGQIVGAVIGALLGGMAGNAIEEDATRRLGLEITVRLDQGPLIAVVQEGDPLEFRIGDRVRVLSGSGETRVTR